MCGMPARAERFELDYPLEILRQEFLGYRNIRTSRIPIKAWPGLLVKLRKLVRIFDSLLSMRPPGYLVPTVARTYQVEPKLRISYPLRGGETAGG